MDETPASKIPRSFWSLNICQALGAMNDNVFRWVMALALVARAGNSETPLHVTGIIFANCCISTTVSGSHTALAVLLITEVVASTIAASASSSG